MVEPEVDGVEERVAEPEEGGLEGLVGGGELGDKGCEGELRRWIGEGYAVLVLFDDSVAEVVREQTGGLRRCVGRSGGKERNSC